METNTTVEYSLFSGVFGGEHHFESIEDASFSVYNICVVLRDNARCKLPATVSLSLEKCRHLLTAEGECKFEGVLIRGSLYILFSLKLFVLLSFHPIMFFFFLLRYCFFALYTVC